MTTAREELEPGVGVAVHVIEPGTPGSGVYDVTQPDYLVLNNPCGELSLYPFETEPEQPCYGLGYTTGRSRRGIAGSATGASRTRRGSRLSPIISCLAV